MAVLNAVQLAQCRRAVAGTTPVMTNVKAQINGAVQALEDWFLAQASARDAAMNAGAGTTLDPAVRAALIAAWRRLY